jgi:hypothetical protein
MSDDMRTSPTPKKSKVDGEMSFPKAIELVIVGKKFTRTEWKSNEIYMYLDNGDLKIKLEDGDHFFRIREVDMVATDWVVV